MLAQVAFRARKGTHAMDDNSVIDIDMKGAPACGRCFMLVARYAPQVVASTGTYHRECFEAWYFGRYGQRPRLVPGTNGDRHRFHVRDREVEDRAA
jgi:hypothetical protein